VPDPPAPGQESVWSYPRPAIARRCPRHIRIEHRGIVIADTRRSIQTLETSHPPSYYLPPADVLMAALRPSARGSFCEWKGQAVYYDLVTGTGSDAAVIEDAAWSYPAPTPAFASLRDHIAFYAGPLDRCMVDDLPVVPQDGGFYGGWITPDLAGPFKGGPGSRFW
jgi:uncharacterized protein (DUF427 family)